MACGEPLCDGRFRSRTSVHPVIPPEGGLHKLPQSSGSFTRKLDADFEVGHDKDVGFVDWLHKRLAAERAAVVSQLQRHIAHQLSDHHALLACELESLWSPHELKAELKAKEIAEPRSSWAKNSRLGECVKEGKDGSVDGTTLPTTPEYELGQMILSVGTNEDQSPRTRLDSSPSQRELERRPSRPMMESIRSGATCTTRGSRMSEECRTYKTPRINLLAYGHTSPLRVTALRSMLHSWRFEVGISILIMLNTAAVVAEVQVVGRGLGFGLGHPEYNYPNNEDVIAAFGVMSEIFTSLFAVEFILRLLDLQRDALRSLWMWFDFTVVLVSVVDLISRFSPQLLISIDLSGVRVGRVCCMLRLTKLLKSQDCFASLFLLLKSIQASIYALVWSCVLLLMVMLIAGLGINQLLLEYMRDTNVPEEKRLEVFNLFGTFSRTFITMFEFTLGNWAPPQRVLMQNVAEWWGLFIVTYRGVFCFALVNISAAVFNSETSKTAAADDEVAMLTRERAAKSYMRKLDTLFKELDISQDGRLTWDEFQELTNDHIMRKFLGTLQIDVEDTRELFDMLSDTENRVMREEFVRGLTMMKGEAKSLDMVSLTRLARNMDGKLNVICSNMNSDKNTTK